MVHDNFFLYIYTYLRACFILFKLSINFLLLVLEMDRTWMYKAQRTDAYFRGQLDKFIQVAKNHARIEKTPLIHCPCRPCKIMRVFNDTTKIRLHVLVGGFVEDYMIWTYHGEMLPSDE